MMINPDETEIRGRWEMAGLKVEGDVNVRRIQTLIETYLKTVAHDETGWETLYVEPNGQRFWELAYPRSDLHGGGPPMLRSLSAQEAREKYGDAAASADSKC